MFVCQQHNYRNSAAHCNSVCNIVIKGEEMYVAGEGLVIVLSRANSSTHELQRMVNQVFDSTSKTPLRVINLFAWQFSSTENIWLGHGRKLSLTLRMISTLAYHPPHSPYCNDWPAGSFAYTTQICTMTSKGGFLRQTLSEIVVTLASPIEIKMHFLDVTVIYSVAQICWHRSSWRLNKDFNGWFCGHLWSFAVKPCVDHTFDIILENKFLKTTLPETTFMVESLT